MQLVGFIMLVIGALVYNEILILPIFGFNRFTKAALKEKLEVETDEATKEKIRLLQRSHIHTKIGEDQVDNGEYRRVDSLMMSTKQL